MKKQAHRLHTAPADVPEDAGTPGGGSPEEEALCQPSTKSTVSSSPLFSIPRMGQSCCLPHPASSSSWSCLAQSFCSGKQGWVWCVHCGEAAPNWARGGHLTKGGWSISGLAGDPQGDPANTGKGI